MIAAYALPPSEWPLYDRQRTTQWIDVIPLYDGPSLLPAAESIVGLSTLADNWDGSGSPRISAAVMAHAIEILSRLGATVQPMSHASPVPGGGLQLEWYLQDRYLEIEIFPDGSLEYLYETNSGVEQRTLSMSDADALRRITGVLAHR